MPRQYILRQHPVIAIGVTAMLLASCAGSGIETAAPPAASADENIVVTGTRVNPRAAARAEIAADVAMAMPAPPPPALASAPPVVAGKMMASQSYLARIAPEPGMPMPYYQDVGRDKFTATSQNPFKVVREDPVSTFSIDVDTASYSFVRASLNQNVLPQPAAVRTEEMVNYFPYNYAAARSADQPFSTNVAVFPSPWTVGRKLVRIGIRGYELQRETRPRANLVFLIDTSGSMNAPNKLPLVKQSLAMLLDQLDADDRVSIVTYAGSAGTALEPTRASEKSRILGVIDRLGAGGSTAGAEGIRQAYALAESNFDSKGVNRVILATDGDFNVGITNQEELKGYIFGGAYAGA